MDHTKKGIEMTKDFIKFLKENDAYDNFIAEIEKDKDAKKRMIIGNPMYYITNAFVWAHTPQGSDYWTALSDKWVESL